MSRQAQLGEGVIYLQGRVPVHGERLTAEFVIPAARLAEEPLTAERLRRGVVVASTLPNIQKHACLARIVELEERGHERVPGLRIVHISADHEEHWREVDQFHPNVRWAGYSLCFAEPASREAIVRAFGVGVEDHHRIAHGLFALRDGIFLLTDIPADQMRPADVDRFIERLTKEIGASSRTAPRVDEKE